jgi:hypothetical protein
VESTRRLLAARRPAPTLASCTTKLTARIAESKACSAKLATCTAQSRTYAATQTKLATCTKALKASKAVAATCSTKLAACSKGAATSKAQLNACTAKLKNHGRMGSLALTVIQPAGDTTATVSRHCDIRVRLLPAPLQPAGQQPAEKPVGVHTSTWHAQSMPAGRIFLSFPSPSLPAWPRIERAQIVVW